MPLVMWASHATLAQICSCIWASAVHLLGLGSNEVFRVVGCAGDVFYIGGDLLVAADFACAVTFFAEEALLEAFCMLPFVLRLALFMTLL